MCFLWFLLSFFVAFVCVSFCYDTCVTTCLQQDPLIWKIYDGGRALLINIDAATSCDFMQPNTILCNLTLTFTGQCSLIHLLQLIYHFLMSESTYVPRCPF